MPDDKKTGRVLTFGGHRSASAWNGKSSSSSMTTERKPSSDDAKKALIDKLRRSGYLNLKRG
jgi:hypothetical protein